MQGFETMFKFTFGFSFVMFILVFGIVLFTFIKGISQWNKNNHSPRLTVNAKVVTKTMNVSRYHHHHHNTHMHSHTSTSSTYYVTFEVESGDRMELIVPRSEYGLIVEGDQGKLTFQGTRYLSFERGY